MHVMVPVLVGKCWYRINVDVYVCVCVYVYIFIYLCMYACMYVCLYAYMVPGEGTGCNEGVNIRVQS